MSFTGSPCPTCKNGPRWVTTQLKRLWCRDCGTYEEGEKRMNQIRGEAGWGVVTLERVDGDEPEEIELAPSLAVANHSPDGFAWGYSGSGPTQLALAILLKFAPAEKVIGHYTQFRDEFLSKVDAKAQLVLNMDVNAWIGSKLPETKEWFRAGLRRYALGERLKFSTGIDGDPTFGYGSLDDHGFWSEPVPYEYLRQDHKDLVRDLLEVTKATP